VKILARIAYLGVLNDRNNLIAGTDLTESLGVVSTSKRFNAAYRFDI
jgi:hypothetical protein